MGGSFECSAKMAANQTGNGAPVREGGSHEGPCSDFREQICQEAADVFSDFTQPVRRRFEADFT